MEIILIHSREKIEKLSQLTNYLHLDVIGSKSIKKSGFSNSKRLRYIYLFFIIVLSFTKIFKRFD